MNRPDLAACLPARLPTCPAGWLQVKCLRVLQYFPPPEDPAVRRVLVDVVKHILGGA